ncbi:MAG: hypothetical protein NVS9B4_25880 [Candidatus Acidiferrum sp.]
MVWQLFAPRTSAQDSPQQTRALRVDTHLVQVNVIVEDKRGEPIAGLTKDDFTLVDQGRPQSIATFSQEGAEVRQAASDPLPANVFTNRFEQGGVSPGSITVILFDSLNTQFSDQAYARQQLLKVLRQLQPQDRVAIYGLTNRLQVLQEFTQDSAVLIRAMEKYSGRSSLALDASTPNPDTPDTSATPTADLSAESAQDAAARQVQEFLASAERQMSQHYMLNRVEITTAALEAIANHIAYIPGRKNLVWVSGSFPIAMGMDAASLQDFTSQSRTFHPEILRATRVLNQANIAVYPVDARGLMGLPDFSARVKGNSSVNRAIIPPKNVDTENFVTMEAFASRTGGRAFYNTNDIRNSVRAAISDGRLTYAIGYYPQHGKWDGTFHEITIAVKRPGARIRYRKGYFAAASAPVADENERKASLNAALSSPVDFAELSVRVEATSGQPSEPGVIGLKIWLDPRQLRLEENGGLRRGGLEFVLAQEDDQSKTLATDNHGIAIALKPEQYQAMSRTGFALAMHLRVSAGASILKIIVRDTRAGTMGSLKLPLKKFLPA